MAAEATLVSAFLVGLLGSTHCLGMCGGIVGALTLGLKQDIRRSPVRLFPICSRTTLAASRATLSPAPPSAT